MNVVFIVPTGVGAEIGGHSGDATPAAKLVASVCDTLIVHPNAVNASDINEMTDNMLYVEGSMLDRFLEGEIGLKEVCSNRILLVVNTPILNEIINAINAARVTIGAEIEYLELDTPLTMTSILKNDKATGAITGIEEMVNQIQYKSKDFDVLIINTPISTPGKDVLQYLGNLGGTNPWGGVEAKLSLEVSSRIGKPVIHAPIENSPEMKAFNKVVDPRKAAELVSVCYIHCCFKGAHKAPKISMADEDWWNSDIDFLVTPASLWGRPHKACQNAGIQIIEVLGNKPESQRKWDDYPNIGREGVMFADNYLTVVGIIAARKAGVTIDSVTNNVRVS